MFSVKSCLKECTTDNVIKPVQIAFKVGCDLVTHIKKKLNKLNSENYLNLKLNYLYLSFRKV